MRVDIMSKNLFCATEMACQLVNKIGPGYIAAPVALGCLVLLAVAISLRVYCSERYPPNEDVVENIVGQSDVVFFAPNVMTEETNSPVLALAELSHDEADEEARGEQSLSITTASVVI